MLYAGKGERHINLVFSEFYLIISTSMGDYVAHIERCQQCFLSLRGSPLTKEERT